MNREVTYILMTMDTRLGLMRATRRNKNRIGNQVAMTAHAVLLQDGLIARSDPDRLMKILQRKRQRVIPAVACLGHKF